MAQYHQQQQPADLAHSTMHYHRRQTNEYVRNVDDLLLTTRSIVDSLAAPSVAILATDIRSLSRRLVALLCVRSRPPPVNIFNAMLLLLLLLLMLLAVASQLAVHTVSLTLHRSACVCV